VLIRGVSRSHGLQQHVLAQTLRMHPEWSLEELFGFIDRGRGLAPALGKLRVSDLFVEPDGATLLADAMEPRTPDEGVDPRRRMRAEQLEGELFDQLVLEVLREAAEVKASYLRERLGGPRWKLQGSLGRLVRAGKASRSGTTSATTYSAGTGQS
jgi:hypothetical protein